MIVPGLRDSDMEFFAENGEVFLIHSGTCFQWNHMPIKIKNLINKAWLLPQHAALRNHIKLYLNNADERLKEFCRIVWGQLDHNPDISQDGAFIFESSEAHHFTKREKEFMKYVCQDMADKEIADKMKISYNTATTYRQNITNKIGANSKVGIALYAIRTGIV